MSALDAAKFADEPTAQVRSIMERDGVDRETAEDHVARVQRRLHERTKRKRDAEAERRRAEREAAQS